MVADTSGKLEAYALEYTNYTKNIAATQHMVKEKVVDMKKVAFLDLTSINHPEVPFIGVLTHDYDKIEFRLLSDKTFGVLKVFKLKFDTLGLEGSLVNTLTKSYHVKEGTYITKYDEAAFMDNLKVLIYQVESQNILEIAFTEADMHLGRTIGMVGFIDEEFIVTKCNEKTGMYITIDRSLRSIVANRFDDEEPAHNHISNTNATD